MSLVFALPLAALLFWALWGRACASPGRPLEPWCIPFGVFAGILLIPLHEWLHAAIYPKNAEAYIGLIPKQFMAYAHCAAPLSKKRFILMCLLPMILGLLPFLLFLICPLNWPGAAAVLWPCAMVGLVSPSPDYLNVFLVCRAAPKGALIQNGKDGLYWFCPKPPGAEK
ncbi:MAG: DUF3267 domain-containing protein [Oscillospiraceae bacterium]|nr:DUF3267 domain-containing protein [Oscillospiraceae bacterium]